MYCFSFSGITNFDFLVHSLQYRCCCSGSFQWCCFIEVRNITYIVALFHSNNLNTFKHNLKNYFLNELKNSNDTIKIYFCFQLLKKLLDFNFERFFVEGPQCKYKLLKTCHPAVNKGAFLSLSKFKRPQMFWIF